MSLVIIISLIVFLFIISIIYYVINKKINNQIQIEEENIKKVGSEIKYVNSELNISNSVNKLNFNNISSRFYLDSNNYNNNILSLKNYVDTNNNTINSNINYQETSLNDLSSYAYGLSNSFNGNNIYATNYKFSSNSSYGFDSNSINTNIGNLNTLNLSNNSIYTSSNKLNIDVKGDYLAFKTGSGLSASFIHDAYGNTILNKGQLIVNNNNLTVLSTSNGTSNGGVFYSTGLGYSSSPTDVSGITLDNSNNFIIYSLNRSVNVNGAMYTSNNDVVFAGKIIGNEINLPNNQKLCIGKNCLTNTVDSLMTNKFNANSLCTNNACWSNYNGKLFTTSPIAFSNSMSLSGSINMNNAGSICLSNLCINYNDLKILRSNAKI